VTHRIAGDTDDLPEGWIVDDDNWGARPKRAGDEERFKTSPPYVWMRACFEKGMLCVLTAKAAHYMDGADE
jgi:hypothetical protein